LTLAIVTSIKNASNFSTSWRMPLKPRGEKALQEYSDNWVEQCSIREMGWFYLGYAAALRFFGNSPAIKLIEGGRKDELKPAPLKSEFKLEG
jgi:hypothetical protein